MSSGGVGAVRFAAQHVGSSADSIETAVSHLVAVQAQSLRGAELALRVRSAIASPTELRDLINSGDLVLSWLNRSTLHLVTRADYWMLHSIVAPAGMRRVGQRLRSARLSDSDVQRALEAQRNVLTTGDAVPKSVLADALRTALPAFDLSNIAVASLIEYAAAVGALVRGPLDQTEPLYVDAATWLGAATPPNVDELSLLAARYAKSHAAATADDAAYWLGVAKRELRSAWAEPSTLTEETTWTGLLGPFDPLLHGWPDRSWILGEYADRVVSTNGIFRPSVIVNNRCVGIWSHANGDVALELFKPLDDEARAPVNADVERVLSYIGAK